ncbi:hypothetical protein WJX75_003235 [Coccomyxa subellipsoidea]|uniref:Glycosyltransferase 2-like domain-containing protein n=1 Tax=Coccomyxa subellipsoidea TaxID=248742 RepID=A0ABR2YM98_9CHLO
MGAAGSRRAADQNLETAPKHYRIIIPCLDEEQQITSTVKSALQRGQLALESITAVVVDGDSSDGTVRAAQRAGAKVVQSPRGRGIQLNRGAVGAKDNQLLLFLHADTQLPTRYDAGITRAFEKFSEQTGSKGLWGCFSTIQLDQRSLDCAALCCKPLWP